MEIDEEIRFETEQKEIYHTYLHWLTYQIPDGLAEDGSRWK